jgi:hypothetical protein
MGSVEQRQSVTMATLFGEKDTEVEKGRRVHRIEDESFAKRELGVRVAYGELAGAEVVPMLGGIIFLESIAEQRNGFGVTSRPRKRQPLFVFANSHVDFQFILLAGRHNGAAPFTNGTVVSF